MYIYQRKKNGALTEKKIQEKNGRLHLKFTLKMFCKEKQKSTCIYTSEKNTTKNARKEWPLTLKICKEKK